MTADINADVLGNVRRMQLPIAAEITKMPHRGRAIINSRRIVVEVAAIPCNGVTFGGHLIPGPKTTPHPESNILPGTSELVPTLIEIYEVRLPALLELVRTPEHEAMYQRACEVAANLRERWLAEDIGRARKYESMRGNPIEQAEWLHIECSISPESCLDLVGAPRTGLPPLAYCKVRHASTGEALDARAWLALDDADRAAWTIDPPPTVENASERATEHMASVLARAMLEMRRLEREDEDKSGGKRRGS